MSEHLRLQRFDVRLHVGLELTDLLAAQLQQLAGAARRQIEWRILQFRAAGATRPL